MNILYCACPESEGLKSFKEICLYKTATYISFILSELNFMFIHNKKFGSGDNLPLKVKLLSNIEIWLQNKYRPPPNVRK